MMKPPWAALHRHFSLITPISGQALASSMQRPPMFPQPGYSGLLSGLYQYNGLVTSHSHTTGLFFSALHPAHDQGLLDQSM